LKLCVVLPALAVLIMPAFAADYDRARESMVETQLLSPGRDISDPKTIQAMSKVPRHEFVPQKYLDRAYGDHPLPIGFGQTISQPYIVALMTQLLELKGEEQERVLEIGTGSGYQAAVLAEVTKQVYTVEVVPQLQKEAAERLKRLGYDKVKTARLDGYYGWEEHAPFDAIIVTAAADHVPPPLIRQLKDGGRLVIPVGPQGAIQTLWLIKKQGEQLKWINRGPVRFVPLVRQPE